MSAAARGERFARRTPQPVGSRLFEVTLADHLPAGASDAGMKRGIVEALALWPQLEDERFELDGRHVSCDGRNERLRQGEAIFQGTSARFLYDPTENGGRSVRWSHCSSSWFTTGDAARSSVFRTEARHRRASRAPLLRDPVSPPAVAVVVRVWPRAGLEPMVPRVAR